MTLRHLLPAAVFLIMVVSGCADRHPARLPIAGRVTIDGQPLTLGQIEFVSDHGRPAVGAIQSDGSFFLTTYRRGDGALVGTHRVVVVANESLTTRSRRWHAPQKYANHRTTDLEFEVSQQRDDVEIALTWGHGKPFVEKW